MLTQDAVGFFGNRNRIRRILNYSSTGAVYRWGEIVPARAAMQLHALSDNRIPLRLSDYSDPETRKDTQ